MCGNSCVDACIHNKASTEAKNEIARLRKVLQGIADHHDAQRAVWGDECGDADQAEYHEERRNFALFHLTPNF